MNVPINVVNSAPKKVNLNPKKEFLKIGNKKKQFNKRPLLTNISKQPIKSSRKTTLLGILKTASPEIVYESKNLVKPISDEIASKINNKQKISRVKPDKNLLSSIQNNSVTLSENSIKPTILPLIGNDVSDTIDGVQNSKGIHDSVALSSFDLNQESGSSTNLQNFTFVNEKNLYFGVVKERISRNWRILEKQLDDTTILVYRLTLSPAGEILFLGKVSGEAAPVVENGVEKAISVSAPFPKFPESFPQNQNFSFKLRFAKEKINF